MRRRRANDALEESAVWIWVWGSEAVGWLRYLATSWLVRGVWLNNGPIPSSSVHVLDFNKNPSCPASTSIPLHPSDTRPPSNQGHGVIMASATPFSALNAMISPPMPGRPAARAQMASNRQLAKFVRWGPRASDSEPARKKKDDEAR